MFLPFLGGIAIAVFYAVGKSDGKKNFIKELEADFKELEYKNMKKELEQLRREKEGAK
jgi:hypothetical protein